MANKKNFQASVYKEKKTPASKILIRVLCILLAVLMVGAAIEYIFYFINILH